VEWIAALGCPHFCLADDAFSLNLPIAKEMLRELARRQLPIAFYATTRPDALDEEICHLLRAARCDHVSMGLESGSQAVLDRMGKQNTVEQNRQVIKWCKQVGLKVTALMIEGNVGETAQTIAETKRFLKQTRPEGMGSVKDLWILPGAYQKWWIDTQATNYVTADQLRVAWTLGVIRRLSPQNILEIGSQTGGMTRLLLPICPDITAIDIVPNQLEMVAQLGVKTHLCFAEDLHNLDIGQFDMVLLTEILNHVPDAPLVVSNAWGKVRPLL